jgi:glycosyltransferase involved in cell wall biosynthesis
MRSAIIHDWLVSSVGGGEKILEGIHQLFPSPIYTLVKSDQQLKGTYFQNLEIHASFIQRLYKAEKNYKNYLPLFPLAIEHFDLKSYDLILSSSHCSAKGVLTSPDQVHICYCHTPMRYAWDLMHDYLRESKLERGFKSFAAKLFLHYLRGWDVHSAHRVDHFVANSAYVAKRIQKFYRREAKVIHPFVDLAHFQEEKNKDDFYLTASRLVPYKRVDLIVEAFAKMPEKKLVVIGDGAEWKKIKEKAAKNIELLGFQSDQVLKKYMQKAKGFVFAALEDFGMIPVEAMASGTPVIAFGKGGVSETVIDGVTGLFFYEQTVPSLIEAIRVFETMTFDPGACRKRAEIFSRENFNRQFQQFVREKI